MTEQLDDADRDSTRFHIIDRVAYLTLNRPAVLNALNPAVLAGISTAVERAVNDPQVRALVFQATGGKAFSVGVDLKYFHDNGIMADPTKNLRFTAHIRDTLLLVENCVLPTVAVVDGFALAGGLELALACDFMICSATSRIGDQHANFDLMPGAGSSQRLPRRIGAQRALELLFTGRRVDGTEAERIGLALRSVPTPELAAAVEEFVAQLRDKSRPMLMAMKSAVHRGMELPITAALDLERLITQEYFSFHGDALAGLVSFNSRPAS